MIIGKVTVLYKEIHKIRTHIRVVDLDDLEIIIPILDTSVKSDAF